MSSSPVQQKTLRVEERCTLNLSRVKTSSRWCGMVVKRGSAISGVVLVTLPWLKITKPVANSPREAPKFYDHKEADNNETEGEVQLLTAGLIREVLRLSTKKNAAVVKPSTLRKSNQKPSDPDDATTKPSDPHDATIKPSDTHDVTIKPSDTLDTTATTHTLAITTILFARLSSDSLCLTSGSGPHQTKSKQRQGEGSEELSGKTSSMYYHRRTHLVNVMAAVAEWYRYRIMAGFVMSSSPVPLKTPVLRIDVIKLMNEIIRVHMMWFVRQEFLLGSAPNEGFQIIYRFSLSSLAWESVAGDLSFQLHPASRWKKGSLAASKVAGAIQDGIMQQF
ncbi:hypothetical protein TNCV_2588081 [Trichonephila clavipes]|nr:hypothetical protein TNCV_2588081 [Trichonephila clavipes]